MKSVTLYGATGRLSADRQTGEGRQPSRSRERSMGAVKWLLSGRLAAAVFIVAYQLIAEAGWGRTIESKTVYVLATAFLALNVAYLVLLRVMRNVDALTRVQIGVDIAIEAALVALTGGVTSRMVVLFTLSIVSASLLLSWRAAAVFTCEAAALHVAAAVIASRGMPALASLREVSSGLLIQLLAFYAVAFLSGLLQHRMAVARLLSRDLLQAIGQGLIVADARGRVLFSNDEARRLIGAAAAAPGRGLFEVLPAEAGDKLRSVALGGHIATCEVVMPAPPGEGTSDSDGEPLAPGEVPVSIMVRPMFSEGGRAAGILAVLTDRTLERRVEEAVMQAHRSEAVSEMATAIAHEIRNPLACMRASIQEIGRRFERQAADPTDSSKSLFDIVLSESDRLDAIVSDFLEFARMRPTRKAPCDIAQVVREMAVMLGQMAKPGGPGGSGRASSRRARLGRTPVEIVTEVNGILECRADAGQLRQVFLNLGINSLEAVSGREGARLVLHARRCPLEDFPQSGGDTDASPPDRRTLLPAGSGGNAGRPGVAVDVEDNGIGMSPETRLRAFDPFFTMKEGGTGLGLAVAEKIVKAHDGLIMLDSKEGVGTVAHVWLPAEPLGARGGPARRDTGVTDD